MPNNRYFTPNLSSEEVLLIDQEFHHFQRVCRGKIGDEVELIDGKGILAIGTVTSFDKECAYVRVKNSCKQAPYSFSLTLCLALLKPSHLEYAVEKATEAGVCKFRLYVADKSEKKELSDTYLKRLQSIILGASKQCGRLFLPELTFHSRLKESLQDELIFFGDLVEGKTFPRTFSSTSISLCIGPESGFSSKERDILLSSKATPISLHPNILRAETAAVAGTLLLFHSLYGAS